MVGKHENGIVYLVGAGSGDAELITHRGMNLLQRAEVVVFDYLANPQLLRHCPNAQTIYVGKKAASHALPQEEINQLLVKLGKEGKRVVRLKGGDPFVFGRGGEECLALKEAGVAFEVVPGITAAIAAPAYAGIPVTHRDLNSSFTLVTGHEKEADYQDPQAQQRAAGKGSDVDWAVLAKLPCLAFYMGVKALPSICRNLLDNGMPADMPAATIQWGTTARQRTVVGTITTLPQLVAEAKLAAPAITLVGRVVGLRQDLNWFETRPLFGQTVVVTRTRQQASDLTTQLEHLGARVIEAPTIELCPPADWTEVDRALDQAQEFDWIIFTSQNGVRFTRQRLMETGRDVRALGKARIAAIGDATAAAVKEQLCLKVDLCPTSFVAEALADELTRDGQAAGKRFLLLRADIARAVLVEKLTAAAAAEVRDVAVYETRPVAALSPMLLEELAAGQVQWITFTSSSTASNFVALLGADYRQQLEKIKLASIGPVTSATMRKLGLEPTVEAEVSNIDGLVAKMSK